MPDLVKKRLLIGVTVSLLIHAFVLSLQFGIPGLGLPGIEMPWEKRRAPTPPLSIQIANALPPAASASVPDLPAPPLAMPAATPTNTVPTPAPVGAIQLVAPAVPQPLAAPLKPVTVKNKTAIKKIAQLPTPPAPGPGTTQAVPEELPDNPPRIIAQDQMRDDSFVVPLPSPEEPERKSTAKPEVKPKVEPLPEPVKLADLPEAPDPALQQAAEAASLAKLADEKKPAELIRQDLARQKKLKEEMRQLAEVPAQQQQQKLATKKLEEDNRQLAEELTRKQNEKLAEQAALALQKQQAEELKRQQQESLRLDLARRQEEESKQKQALELQLRKQAEEIAQQQAIAVARQKLEKQAEELAARQKAEQQARQLAEVQAQKERERLAQAAQPAQTSTGQAKFEPRTLAPLGSASSDRAGERSGDSLVGTGNDKDAAKGIVLPKNLLSSDLANRALDQARGLDLLRGNPPVPRSTEDMSKSRRRSFLGSEDKEFPVRMYVESWRQKIERNGNLNYSQVAKDKARGDPVVTVIIRSDGSVEDIIINRSSGRADLDEAVRRIVRVNARYAAFPANIALKYDVIEIRRVWNFDDTLRILEEIR
ncbi:TonB family protein [Undibacterium sp. Jales W-56]|uniref:cell envelope integrity protein TolA n=1 Tax=Undibacterium sp. Jales W-56 TaxID=2897325 RepID=UPI0021CF984E|nr:cell envelope integrity protein TolA [Undibacterium sp. Jales W-56]MCU6432713.1 TonB family protein [Undibacterium sp. Jales W-56]